ncbi:hypothetical protein [Myroides odoratus]|uniref:hypothetical protein n=1 Tax=Myroides odoratus TaxID=256 RepID=UPI00333F20D3
MKNRIFLIAYCCMACFYSSSWVYGQLPYFTTASSEDEFGKFAGSDKVNFSKYGAELTAKANQTSGVFVEDLFFASERGCMIEFDYLMTGKGSNSTQIGANGLALVLFDAKVSNPEIGSKTAGLGYAYSKAVATNQAVHGLSKGFLSIGLDINGDFKERKIGDTEFRNGIYTERKQMNHVTVRGQGDRLEGYPVLISQSVTDSNEHYKLDIATGNYTENFETPDPRGFSFKLRENNANNEGDIQASFGHASYRRVLVALLPTKYLGNPGFSLYVDIIHGSETSRVINSLFIPSNGWIKYYEANTKTADVLKDKKIIAPINFNIGFTATTGEIYQKNIIRNIEVYLPFSPVLKNILVSNACKDHTTTVEVFEHAIGFNTNKYEMGQDLNTLGSREHIDPYSFRFLILEDANLEYTLEPFVAITDNGRYEYNPLTMEVVFTPNKNLTAKEDTVYFTVKNKKKMMGITNLGGEQYRSLSAKIQLNFKDNCNDIIMVNGSSL